jgi:hypothetical protein
MPCDDDDGDDDGDDDSDDGDDEYTNLCLCFPLSLFVYPSPFISFSFLHYLTIYYR